MDLREWGSNSMEFMNFVAEQDRFTYKMLGVTWNSSNDTLTVPGLSYNKPAESEKYFR